jgi:hypothetical protein
MRKTRTSFPLILSTKRRVRECARTTLCSESNSKKKKLVQKINQRKHTTNLSEDTSVEIFQNRNSALVSECTLYDFVPKMVSSLLLLKLILNLCVTIPADNHEVPFTQLQSTKYTTKHYMWFTVSFMHENTSYTSPHTGVPTRLQPYIRVPKLVTPTHP